MLLWHITCSWHQKTNSLIHEFKVLYKGQRAILKPLFNGVLFLIYYFKNHSKPCFLILKALKDILHHFKFVNWWIGEFVFFLYHEQVNTCKLCTYFVLTNGILSFRQEIQTRSCSCVLFVVKVRKFQIEFMKSSFRIFAL